MKKEGEGADEVGDNAMWRQLQGRVRRVKRLVEAGRDANAMWRQQEEREQRKTMCGGVRRQKKQRKVTEGRGGEANYEWKW